jgi:serine/threonine-protein kinase
MIGRVLDGRYRVGSRIARGGMATVYEATDLRLDRVCALKIMHSGLGDDDDFAGRFVREAHSAARLSHPNVVSVFDQGDDDGTLFLAMEYIPGHTLRDMIRKEAPMAPTKALAMLDPVLSALGAAHQAGMIHRDVKPENVLLAEDGRVKVADFGLARAVSAETQHTATGGVLIGTVSYLSPELVIDGRADARSDVYAAGVILYEMLTGRKPHEGDSPIQVAYKHVHEDVPPPSEEVPGIPPYVDALVARATARDRELRPADARVLLHQVRRVRGALDAGLLDDPELTEDLEPTAPVRDLDSIDYVSEDGPAIMTTAQAARGRTDSADHTSIIRGPQEPTPQPPPTGGDDDRPITGPRRSRRGPILLVLVLLLALLAGVSGWWFGMGRYTSTPAVINLTTAQARHKVQAAGLQFQIGSRQYSETVARGSVLTTDPRPGSRVLQNGTVSATVSRGPERVHVPSTRGMTLDEARKELKKDHLAIGTIQRRFSDRVAKGVVLASDPKPNTEVRPRDAVDLTVSKGPQPIDVPDYTGKSTSEAKRALSKLGFDVHVSHQHSDSVPAGDVISQNPSSGTGFRGDSITLVGSTGPVLVQVPNVVQMNANDAVSTLQAAGFQVRTEHSNVFVGLNYVVHQDPGAAAMAPRGSVVTIFLV